MTNNIYKDLINKKLIDEINNQNQKKFNIRLDKYKIYNQSNSMTCWIYASFNLIKRELAKILKINENSLNFSVNYISFFDRYEKLDRLYNEIIDKDYKKEEIKYLLFDYINCFGSFSSFKYLVKKYGLVLEKQMPLNDNINMPSDIDRILKEKIMIDISKILNLKDKVSHDELIKVKIEQQKENYEILSNILGEPPQEFDFKSLNMTTNIDNISPTDFSNKYINSILDKYINIMCLNTKEENKKYEMNFNVPNLEYTEYLNLSIPKIKEAIIKSLKSDCPVWFGCSYRYISGSIINKEGILDSNLYNFNKIGIDKINKKLAEEYDILNYDHAMIFTGVNIENDIPNRWEVLNTFGIENNRSGYFIMSNNFFEENCFLFAIKKEFLS